MNVLSYKCPSCGASLRFSSDEQKLVCDSCDTSYDPQALEQLDPDEAEKDEFKFDDYKGEDLDGAVIYTCPSCGGEIIGDENTVATKCPYCDNATVMATNVSGALKPDLIIPFKLDKDDAKEALRKFYKNKTLMPSAFRDENKIDEIQGIYVPFWLFDCDASSNASYRATRVHTWSDANYIYRRTDHFSVYREGEASFEYVPVDGSVKMDDAFMESIEPYDMSEAIPFGSTYLSGYLADKYNVDEKASRPRACERIKKSMSDMLRKSVVGYASVSQVKQSITTDTAKAKYALLPVWVLNTTWRGKKYTFAMNGQTGKIVGNLPCDIGKFITRFLITAAAIATPLALLAAFI